MSSVAPVLGVFKISTSDIRTTIRRSSLKTISISIHMRISAVSQCTYNVCCIQIHIHVRFKVQHFLIKRETKTSNDFFFEASDIWMDHGVWKPMKRLLGNHISRIQPTMQSWNLDSLALQRWLENFVKLSSFLVSCCVLGLIFRESQIFNFGDFSERPAHFLTIFELLELPGPPNIARVRNWIL